MKKHAEKRKSDEEEKITQKAKEINQSKSDDICIEKETSVETKFEIYENVEVKINTDEHKTILKIPLEENSTELSLQTDIANKVSPLEGHEFLTPVCNSSNSRDDKPTNSKHILSETTNNSLQTFHTKICLTPSDAEISNDKERNTSDQHIFYFNNQSTKISVIDSTDFDEENFCRNVLISAKSKSDPNSPLELQRSASPSEEIFSPIPNIFALNTANLDFIKITSPLTSPSPSPTFSRSSFALNSQFLRSLSISTQDLLNSLVVSSSSLEKEKSPSPTKAGAQFKPSTDDQSDIELALPMLAPTTSLAICKLFSATEALGSNSSLNKNGNAKEMPNKDATIDITSQCVPFSSSDYNSAATTAKMIAPDILLYETDDEELFRDVPSFDENVILSDFAESSFRPITLDITDDDILRHERALDIILEPCSIQTNAMEYPASGVGQHSTANSVTSEVPTLQELASASLPSTRPVSSAIISFSCSDAGLELAEKTHLHRRFNSPEYRKTPSPRLSLRDKFERDLHSKPRQKHSKSLSKNARFQKAPNVRVNSEENSEKKVSKLDKSKSESRIGDSSDCSVDILPKDERVRSEGCLENKRQTTVKFAPLNIEIPNYRDPEIDDSIILDDKTCDGEEYTSPTDEITAEMIRKRLWAGLRSFSVDVDILQAYGILINSEDNREDAILNVLSEHPAAESEADGGKACPCPPRKTSMTAEDVEFLETRRNTRRRGSVAALQELVKENTQLISKIVKNKLANEKEGKKTNTVKEVEIASSVPCNFDGLSSATSCAKNSKTTSESLEKLNGSSLIAINNKTVIDFKKGLALNEKENASEKPIDSSNNNKKMTGAKTVDGLSSCTTQDIDGQLSYCTTQNNDHPNVEENDIQSKNKKVCDGQKCDNFVEKIRVGNAFDSIVTLKTDTSLSTETSLIPFKDESANSSFSKKPPKPHIRDTIVIDKEHSESDSGCFKLPLSAFCVNVAKRTTQIVDRDAVAALDQSTISSQSGIISSSQHFVTSNISLLSSLETQLASQPENQNQISLPENETNISTIFAQSVHSTNINHDPALTTEIVHESVIQNFSSSTELLDDVHPTLLSSADILPVASVEPSLPSDKVTVHPRVDAAPAVEDSTASALQLFSNISHEVGSLADDWPLNTKLTSSSMTTFSGISHVSVVGDNFLRSLSPPVNPSLTTRGPQSLSPPRPLPLVSPSLQTRGPLSPSPPRSLPAVSPLLPTRVPLSPSPPRSLAAVSPLLPTRGTLSPSPPRPLPLVFPLLQTRGPLSPSPPRLLPSVSSSFSSKGPLSSSPPRPQPAVSPLIPTRGPLSLSPPRPLPAVSPNSYSRLSSRSSRLHSYSTSSVVSCPRRDDFSHDNPSKPITFNPFPTSNTNIYRKEVSLKLGLYSPSTE